MAKYEPGDLDDFVSYVKNTWVGPVNKRTGKRQNPNFRHQLWNKNEAILNGDDLTTNSSEGFNLQMKQSIPKNANLWKLIHLLIKDDSLVFLKLRDHALEANTSSSSCDSSIVTSPTNAKEAARQRRKEELQNLGRCPSSPGSYHIKPHHRKPQPVYGCGFLRSGLI